MLSPWPPGGSRRRSASCPRATGNGRSISGCGSPSRFARSGSSSAAWTRSSPRSTCCPRASDLETANEVREAAEALIQQLNGAISIATGARKVGPLGVVRFNENGTHQTTMFPGAVRLEGRSRLTATGVVLGRDGKPLPAPPPKASEVQQWIAKSETDELLADALIYCQSASDRDPGLECAPEGGQFQAAGLTVCWAC